MSQATQEEYRKRYFLLKEKAQVANVGRHSAEQISNPQTLPRDLIVAEETIPAGWYWTRKVSRGQSLRVINDSATHGVSLLLWNAHDTSERYNAGDTVKVQWTARITRGKLLLSDMGRVLASVTDDTCGFHDCIAGGSTRAGDAAKYGPDPVRRNSHENLVLAAGKHGLSLRDIGPCITLFAPVITDPEGNFSWRSDLLAPGQYVDLRAEMDLIVALSNCPHPLSPGSGWRAEPVSVQVWRSPMPASRDFNRTASEEAERAFENTDAFLEEVAR